jgi:hypothetical protein
MTKKNMGELDQSVRFIVELALIPIRILLIIRVSNFTPVVLIFPGQIIFNPGFVPFGISTCEKEGP